MTASPTRRPRALVASLLGATVLAAALPATAALATASPTATPAPSPSASPTATRLPALPAPVLVGPTGYGQTLKDVVLDWQPVPGATTYEVQVGVDEEWSGDPVWTATTLSTQISVPSWLPQADYVWRVAARREKGTGRWSTAGSFRRGWTAQPALLTPANGATVPHWGPEFSWAPVPGASGYELQLSDSPVFDDVDPTQTQGTAEIDTCFTTHTRVTPYQQGLDIDDDAPGDCHWTQLGTDGPVYWRVRALDHLREEAPADAETVPASREGISHLPPVFGEDGAGDQLGTACPKPASTPTPGALPGGGASPTPDASTSASPSASPSPTSAGPKGCEPAHPVERGAWSDSRWLVLQLPAAEPDTTARFRGLPPVQTRPVVEGNPCSVEAGAVTCADVPTLRWDPVPGAVAYRVYVSRTPTYSALHLIADTYGTTFTPTHSFRQTSAGAAFFYAVQPCTEAGCGAVTASPSSFRLAAPRVALAAPADGTALPAGDVVLRWQSWHDALEARAAARGYAVRTATTGASAYRVQVTRADDEDFREPLEEEVVETTQHATLQVAYGDGDFLWRVQAIDGSQQATPWSAPARFSRDTAAPTARLVTTGPARADAPFVLSFSEAVRGLSSASVGVPGAVVRTVVGADARSVALWPKGAWTPGRTYRVELRAGVTDAVGNAAAPLSEQLKADPVVQDGSALMGWSGAWGFRRATDAKGGSFRTSFPAPARQTGVMVDVHGRGVEVLGCTGPSGGLADVYVDGVKRRRIDTWRPWSSCGVVLVKVALPAGDHRVQVRGLGLGRTRSKGTSVSIDAVKAL